MGATFIWFPVFWGFVAGVGLNVGNYFLFLAYLLELLAVESGVGVQE